jgi:hypothetical protein
MLISFYYLGFPLKAELFNSTSYFSTVPELFYIATSPESKELPSVPSKDFLSQQARQNQIADLRRNSPLLGTGVSVGTAEGKLPNGKECHSIVVALNILHKVVNLEVVDNNFCSSIQGAGRQVNESITHDAKKQIFEKTYGFFGRK